MDKRICPMCSQAVEVNGVGPGSSKFMRRATDRFQDVFKFASKVFYDAACQHDMQYHQYMFGKVTADLNFRYECQVAITNGKYNWIQRKYLKFMANKFYKAVKLFGDKAYDSAQKECLMNLVGHPGYRKPYSSLDKVERKKRKTQEALTENIRYFDQVSKKDKTDPKVLRTLTMLLKNRLKMVNAFRENLGGIL